MAIISACANEEKSLPAEALVVSEGLNNPVGLYDDNPTFSWKLPVDILSQSSYSIVVASSPELLPQNAGFFIGTKTKPNMVLLI